MEKSVLNGPIPGENYTSDTKNYPWHRPPEITDIDKGIEAAAKQLTTREGAFGILNTLQAGVTVVQATDMFVTSGVGAGKWTPDFGILLAGPIARIIKIMAEDAGISYAMGLDDKPIPTISYYKKQSEITKDDAEQAGMAAQSQIDQIKPPTNNSGFMNAAPPAQDMTGAMQ